MSRFYWDTPLLSPFLNMDHKQLKRTRSSESLDRSFKRSKGYESEPPKTTIESANIPIYPNISPVPTHIQQQSILKPISISTKTDGSIPVLSSYATQTPVMSYENINGILHSVHIERFGNPENRLQEQDEDMIDAVDNNNNEYNSMNSVLRQAFLQRH